MARGRKQQGPAHDWVTRAADDAVRHAGEGNPVTVASGASPSGPIHLGNLREFLTPHFVAEELHRRGVEVRHIHSWDDYDRFRKVPAGVDPSFSEHIGRPLSGVPDPWACHESWAEHFKAPLQAALREMGVEMVEISQSQMYRSGAYREQILHAMTNRAEIEAILARFRTKKPAAETAESAAQAAALADSVADDDDNVAEGAGSGDPADADLSRLPYKPWCAVCGRDTTTATSWSQQTADLGYTCECGHTGSTNLRTEDGGKLVWKVDWPMRWAYEGVDFEPGGLDHATPGSSYTVGAEVVKLFGALAPSFVSYGFVGMAGRQKMSSSTGGVPTPADALQILEAPMVRWLYTRRAPKQAFTIDFGPEVVRLYDEWDALGRKAADPAKRDVAVLAWERASSTHSAGRLPTPPVVVPFRTLSSVADVTAESADQISRIIRLSDFPHDEVDALEPRLTRAINWIATRPEEERTTVRATADEAALTALAAQESEWLLLLLQGLAGMDELEIGHVTSLVYGVPKLARGLGLDDAPTDEVKADQKEFFRLLYHLLVDAERGPRLPTLIVALGAEKVRSLLSL